MQENEREGERAKVPANAMSTIKLSLKVVSLSLSRVSKLSTLCCLLHIIRWINTKYMYVRERMCLSINICIHMYVYRNILLARVNWGYPEANDDRAQKNCATK